MSRYVTILGCDRAVGKKYASGIVRDIPAVEEVPRHPVSKDGPVANQPRVVEIKPFVTWRRDLTVLLCQQHHVAVVNGKLWRADRDLKSHDRADVRSPCGRWTAALVACERFADGKCSLSESDGHASGPPWRLVA